jgi:hypothetical protein
MHQRPAAWFWGGRVSPSVSSPPARGAERRQALVGKRPTRDPPRGRVDLRIAGDHRPMTPAGAPLGAPPRLFSVPGRAFQDGFPVLISQLLAGGS